MVSNADLTTTISAGCRETGMVEIGGKRKHERAVLKSGKVNLLENCIEFLL